MEKQILVTNGSMRGSFTNESEVVLLNDNLYSTFNHEGVDYPPTAIIDDAVKLCGSSEYEGYILECDCIVTEDGYVYEDETVIYDSSNQYDLPILMSNRDAYNMVRDWERNWISTDSDDVYYGVINSGGSENYFFDEHGYRCENERGDYYRTVEIAEELGLVMNDDGYMVPEPRWLCGYGEANHRDYSDDAKIKFGIEVEKEDQDVLESIEHNKIYNRTGWAKERDGSLDDGGYELVSPCFDLMDLKKFYKAMEDMNVREHINADYSDRCGGHITISYEGYTASELYEGMTGFFPLIYALYPKRTETDYCKAKCKRDMGRNPQKYSAFYIKNGMLESRIFPAFRNVENVKWRIELMQIVIKNINSSEGEVLKMLVNKNSKLNKHITKMYKMAGRDVNEAIVSLCDRFVQYARQYNHCNLTNSLETLRTNLKNKAA
jgi:hypothetical protein